ncbi:hypothetical protein VNO77_39050 [Canavalia gladiata]|uniref:Uncharacterized protein n=1 Tax=Canavalia gladiata TaxID=3824 RepID=A0AAN9PZD7_CANGL
MYWDYDFGLCIKHEGFYVLECDPRRTSYVLGLRLFLPLKLVDSVFSMWLNFSSFLPITLTMEAIVKKFQSKFRKVREEINHWDELQSSLISQFRNASHIFDRLQVLQNSKNYGVLNCVSDMKDALVAKQIESLENILVSMRRTLEKFHCIVLSLEKIHRDSRQLVKGSSSRLTMKQLQRQVGVKPRLIDCLDGLMFLQEIYNSEYLLKSSVISALSAMAIKPSAGDLGALQQLLVDQPNLHTEEVQFVFDIIFAEELP